MAQLGVTTYTAPELITEVNTVIKIAPEETELREDLTQGRPHRALLKKIINFVAQRTANIAPPAPVGVSWVTPPTNPFTGAESASVIRRAGITVNVAAMALPFIIPFAPATGHREDVIALNTNPLIPVYERLEGETVHYLDPLVSPTLPAGYLHVRSIQVTDGIIKPVPVITPFIPIPAETYGTEPAKDLNDINEAFAYILAKLAGVVIPNPTEPDPTEPEINDLDNTAAFRPKTGATAGDYEYELTPPAPTGPEADNLNNIAAFAPTPGTTAPDYEYNLQN